MRASGLVIEAHYCRGLDPGSAMLVSRDLELGGRDSPSLAPAVGRDEALRRESRPPQNSIISTISTFPPRKRSCLVESQHARRAMCIWAVIDWMAMQADHGL